MIQQNITGWLFRYDYDYRIPYVSNNEMFIGYENEISVQEKVKFLLKIPKSLKTYQTIFEQVDFVVAKNLGGLMAKFIDLDDSKNTCGAWYPSFPIISSIKTRLEFWTGNLIRLEASK
jgi:GH18 family chitinase